ncbi:MAG: hypothetical protein HQK99_15950 [Nitrospirae bacterium]|nr:hypothetical protein [Nitrospirota bacterium]
MSYTIAKSLGMRPRRLEEIIPAAKLEMLEPIMQQWAGKIYENFACDVDKAKIGELVGWIYASNKYQRPKVIYTYNPEIYKYLVAEMLINKKDTPAGINMKSYLCEMVKAPVWFSINTESERTFIEHFQTSFKDIILRLAFRNSKEFGHFISPQHVTNRNVISETWGDSFALPSYKWLRNAQQNHLFNGSGLWSDSAWFFLFDYISAIGIRRNELIDKYKVFLQSGVLSSMFFEKNAIILIQPKITKMTANNQLHCDGDAAIDWRDGHKTYLLHNVLVPEHLAVTPHHKLDPELVLTGNTEIRREIVRKIGMDRLIAHFGAVVIDRYYDYELIELSLREIDVTGRYLKIKDPSIGTWHVEGVPPEINTCKQALEWRKRGLAWNPQQLTC